MGAGFSVFVMDLPRVLVLDQQTAFIDFCRAHLEPAGFAIHAVDPDRGSLDPVDVESYDLALVELTGFSANGLDTLRQWQGNGRRLPTIITSARETIAMGHVAEATTLGAVDFIEKPCPPAQLVDKVRAAWQRHDPRVVKGNLRVLNLPGLISTNCNEGKRAALDITHREKQARIFFDGGEVVHATVQTPQADQSGEEAVFTALTWEEGDFVMRSGVTAPTRTIHTGWSGLVLEGLRRLDEEAFDEEGFPSQASDAADMPEEPLLDWEMEPLSTESPTRAPAPDLNSETQDQVEDRVQRLYEELQPRFVFLTTRSGRLICARGEEEGGKSLSLAALVAGSFSATDEIAQMIAKANEPQQAFQQSLQEGEAFNLYSSQVGVHWILSVVIGQKALLGLSRQLALRAAEELEMLLSQPQEDTAQREEVAETMNDLFRQEVDDALGDLFG